MRNEAKLRQQIEEIIEAKFSTGSRQLRAPWITHAVVKAHPLPRFKDHEFYRAGVMSYVHSVVLGVVRAFEGGPTKGDDRQLVLPGYEHAQRIYTIRRKGKSVVVPIEQMTDEELEAKGIELERMAQGLSKHAFEIRRYAHERRGQRKAS